MGATMRRRPGLPTAPLSLPRQSPDSAARSVRDPLTRRRAAPTPRPAAPPGTSMTEPSYFGGAGGSVASMEEHAARPSPSKKARQLKVRRGVGTGPSGMGRAREG